MLSDIRPAVGLMGVAGGAEGRWARRRRGLAGPTPWRLPGRYGATKKGSIIDQVLTPRRDEGRLRRAGAGAKGRPGPQNRKSDSCSRFFFYDVGSDSGDAVGDAHSASLFRLHALSVSNTLDIKLFDQRSASAFHSYVHRAL